MTFVSPAACAVRLAGGAGPGPAAVGTGASRGPGDGEPALPRACARSGEPRRRRRVPRGRRDGGGLPLGRGPDDRACSTTPSCAASSVNLRDVTERRRDRDRLARLTQQLQQALTTRVVIEQAKGMVAAQRGIGVEEAFEVLRRHARDHNATLQAVAGAVVTLGLRP